MIKQRLWCLSVQEKQQKLDGLIKGSKWDKARVLLGNLLMLQDFD